MNDQANLQASNQVGLHPPEGVLPPPVGGGAAISPTSAPSRATTAVGGEPQNVGFGDVLRAELIKLTSLRGTRYVPLGAMLLPLLGAVLVAALTNDEVVDNLTSVAFGTLIIPFSAILGFVTTIVTSEYNHDTIRVTYAATPRRLRSVLAKYLIAIPYSVISLLLSVGIPLIVGLLIAAARGQGGMPEGDDLASLAWALFIIGCGCIAAVSLGYFVRNSAAAVSIAAVYPLGSSIVLSLLALASWGPKIVRWFPLFGAINIDIGEEEGLSEPISLGFPWAYIYLAVVVLAIAALATWLERRRDV